MKAHVHGVRTLSGVCVITLADNSCCCLERSPRRREARSAGCQASNFLGSVIVAAWGPRALGVRFRIDGLQRRSLPSGSQVFGIIGARAPLLKSSSWPNVANPVAAKPVLGAVPVNPIGPAPRCEAVVEGSPLS